MSKVKEIKLGEKRDHRPRPVEIHLDNGDYHLFTIEELMKLLELWIVGEEEVYPQPQFQGRWLLFEKIKEVFDDNTR